MTFRKVMEAWLVEGCARWTKAVQGQVCPMAWRWLDIIGGVDDGKTMTPAQVLSIAKERRKRCGPAACAREKAFLVQFLKFAERMGCGGRDGWRAAEVWKVGKQTVKKVYVALTEEQAAALKAAAWEVAPWLGAFVTVALGTGLRSGAVMLLTPSMVKDGNVLEVPARIQKTREPLRVVVSDAVADAIKNYPRPSSKTALRRAFARAVKKAGVPDETRPHDLRRTWCSKLSRMGATLPTIMALGGWSSVSTILKTYVVKPSVDEMRKWVQ